MMILIWLILLLGVTRGIGLRGGRQIPMPPLHLKPKLEQCKHKWKYIGFYNSGYYNHKQCVYCDKLELEKTKRYDRKTTNTYPK